MLDLAHVAFGVALYNVGWQTFTDLKRNKVDERKISFMQGVTLFAWFAKGMAVYVLPAFILSGIFSFIVLKGLADGDKLNMVWILPFVFLFRDLFGLAVFFLVSIIFLLGFYFADKRIKLFDGKIPFLPCMMAGLFFVAFF